MVICCADRVETLIVFVIAGYYAAPEDRWRKASASRIGSGHVIEI